MIARSSLDGRNADGQGSSHVSQSFVFHNCSTRYFICAYRYSVYLRSDNAINKVDVEKMEVLSSIPIGNLAMFFCIKGGNKFQNTE